MTIRIGQGFDVHAFTENKPLVLGPQNIPFELGMKAHSDGDVVIHALCDALLGALALGDIGQHFPDTDEQYAGADSKQLLQHVWGLIQAQDFQLANADITIVAQQPRMSPHIVAMREQLSTILGCDMNQISIKATTTEHLGFTGRREGIAVFAVTLLQGL